MNYVVVPGVVITVIGSGSEKNSESEFFTAFIFSECPCPCALFTITSVARTAETPSAPFCGLWSEKRTFPCPDP